MLIGFAAPAVAIDDAQVVYCLADKQRPELRSAAIALGKAEPAALADLDAWRKRDRRAFEETCTALFESAKPQPGVFADVLPFLTALAAAVLTYLAAFLQERRTRRRQQADGLRAALAEFDSAAQHYAHVLTGERPVERLRSAHATLAVRLAEAKAEHPGWALARACHQRMVAGDLGIDELTSGWVVDKESRAKQVRARLAELHDGVQRVAAGLLRPRRRDPDKAAA
ncbi:hypothetical protein [Actinokineospora sp. NPDC004072]